MPQSKQEAERLMEQQHYGGDYISPLDIGLANPDGKPTICVECGEPLGNDAAGDMCFTCAEFEG
jgi:hypothetical protein